MRVAIFGKTIDDKSLKNLATLMELFRNLENVQWQIFKPFYDKYEGNVIFPCGRFFHDHSDLAPDTDIFLSLGGDGTFLNSLTIVRDSGIPIAGINFGRLGFLTTESVGEENHWVERLVKGDYSIEKRTLLYVSSPDVDDVDEDSSTNEIYPYALNEMSIQRTEPAMLEIHVTVNDQKIPVYWADGILIATPTGSTAYSLSVGGPVVIPESNVLIIAPIASHNLNVRPLIVPRNAQIELSFTGRSSEAQLTIDNRYYKVKKGTTVTVKAASFTLNCVTISNNFIKALNQKLLWGEDKRNLSI